MANMSFNFICEIQILAKISGFTVNVIGVFCFIAEEKFRLKMGFCDIFARVGQTLARNWTMTVIIVH